MKEKNPKSILRLLIITILGLPGIFIELLYCGLRVSHKILFILAYFGICYGILVWFEEKNPLDKVYSDSQAMQLRKESYLKIRQEYEKKYKITLFIFFLLLSLFHIPVEVIGCFLNPITGSSGPLFMIFSAIMGSIPIHIFLAIRSYFHTRYKAVQTKETEKVAEQLRQERERVENQRRELQERSERLWKYLLEEYSVPRWVWNIMAGNSGFVFGKILSVREDQSYEVVPLCADIYSVELPEAWLQNADRIQWIDEYFAEAQSLFPGLLSTMDRTKIIPGCIGKSLRGTIGHITYCPKWDERVDIIGGWIEQVIAARLDYYNTEYKIAKSGEDGEIAVQRVLDMHPGAFFALHNIRLEYVNQEGRTVSIETDTIILAPNGIYAVEVKNYGSFGKYKIVVTQDGNWYKEFTKSREYSEGGRRKFAKETVREPLLSAFAQNSLHIGGLELIINEILGRDMAHRVYIENVVVIANDEVEINSSLQGRQMLTRVGTLYDCLSKNRESLFSMEELTKIKAELEARNLPAKKYPIHDYKPELRKFADAVRVFKEARAQADAAYQQCGKDHPEI